jgi:hypothetical protein
VDTSVANVWHKQETPCASIACIEFLRQSAAAVLLQNNHLGDYFQVIRHSEVGQAVERSLAPNWG